MFYFCGMRYHTGILLLLLLSIASCTKQKGDADGVLKYQLPVNGDVFDITGDDNGKLYACGGKQGKNGFICSSDNGGESWQLLYQNDSACLFTIAVSDYGQIWCGGDKLCLISSIDKGNTWQYALGAFDYSHWSDFITAFRDISISGSCIYVCGGDLFYKGIVFRSYNNGWWWENMNYDHEFYSTGTNSVGGVILAGYGALMLSSDSAKSWNMSNTDKEFFTGISAEGSYGSVCCGYSGGIWGSRDGGQQWHKLFQNSSLSFTGIIQLSVSEAAHTTSGIIACSRQGVILTASSDGNQWKKKNISSKAALNCIYYDKLRATCYSGSDNGKIFCFIP
jgi:photosystem II stability/assembly factor-like uncharacterized protein